MLKKIIKSIIVFPALLYNFWIDVLSLFSKRFKKISLDFQMDFLDNQLTQVVHAVDAGKNNIHLSFYTPNSMCMFRAESFSDKEPETLDWIKEFGKDKSVLFDIGANIGLYSIYHNKLNGGASIAFEPSFFNLKLLLKNININNCKDLTSVVTNPLSDKVGSSEFIYGSDVEGGALSAFGVEFGHDGEKIDKNLTCNTIGFSLDYMIEKGIVDTIPNLIKLDVDGIEHIIIKGAENTLKRKECRSILVEVNDSFVDQADKVNSLLTDYGYIRRDKLHGQSTENSELFATTYNQIWVKC